MLVHYFSHAGSQTGPGRAAADWQKALRIVGVDVVEHTLKESPPPKGILLYHGSPAQLALIAEQNFDADSFDDVCRVALTTWETSRLPSQFVERLCRYDGIITPSEFSRDVINHDMTNPEIVHVVPHCFDGNDWPATNRTSGDLFTFYTIGGWGERKNVLGVLRAYLHEFTKADRTRLVILSDGSDFGVLRSVIARSGIAPADLPGLLVPDRSYSPEELVRLHQDSDCFVSTTRGEAWGLGMFEAMVMQRPVVAPQDGGQADFLDGFDGDQYFPVSTQATPVFAGEGEVVAEGNKVTGRLRLPNGADARQLWQEPDLAVTAHRMRTVYDRFWDSRDYSTYEENRQELEDRYSAPVVGQLLLGALKEISGS
jgi:glycosyltransferase involved in cell wall biosynthesis